MSTRSACCVPFCRRSRLARPEFITVDRGGYDEGYTVTTDINEEWICEGHWRAIPARLRALRNHAKKRLKQRRTLTALLVFVRIWGRCKRAAIELAGGLR